MATIMPAGVAVTSAALPAGFTETTIWGSAAGLLNPTNIEFASDGRVFVAEKRGQIKVFDSVADTTPTIFADASLQANVHNFWDRGLLGMTLDPSLKNPALPLRPWVYVLYTYDHILGSATPAPRWGDACANPPGATTDGCVVSGRLSRFTVNGSTISGPETVLIEDWCNQFPSHTVGDLSFGPDGALYVSGGDGASFNAVDYGQFGGTLGLPNPPTPKNPCGDPPNDGMTPPTAEGGALRSQDLRTESAPPTGGSYSAAVLQDAPAAYWRLGESSGTIANDEIGPNDGTYVGTPTLGVAGPLGDGNTAASFAPASVEYVTVPDSATFDLGLGDYSIEFWFKTTSRGVHFLVDHSTENGTGFEAWWDGDHLVSRVGASQPQVTSGGAAGALANNAWHHAVLTMDRDANGQWYVDGVASGAAVNISSHAGESLLGSDPVFLARRLTGLLFDGALDEVAIYKTALSAARVQAHFAAAGGSGGGGGGTTDPTTLDGSILRVDPVTGAAAAGNPYASSSDANKQRIIAYGLRNPFRFEFRPGTDELWLGDVGWNNWEEINRIANVGDATVENFGWPCYEGSGVMSGYDNANLSICENLYAAGPSAITAPVFSYLHSGSVVPGDGCPTGSSAITGMAFYPETGGNFPAQYRGGLFFADHNRSCIWWMAKGANGQPDPTTRAVFQVPAANPVDLEIGPDGALYYADFDGSTIRRIAFTSGNQPPIAVAQGNPTSGTAPLTVAFNGSGSSDPDAGDTLTYAWDLDGDGGFDDSTAVSPNHTYTNPGIYTAALQVTDNHGSPSAPAQVPITVNGTGTGYPGVVGILSPVAYWRLGETSGTVAADSVGTNTGTYAGGITLGVPGLLSGDPNTAVNLDGINDQVTVPNAASLNQTSQISIAAWIKADDWTGRNPRIVQKGLADSQYKLLFEGGNLVFNIAGKGTAAAAPPPNGVRHFVVGTYDGASIRLYVDNVLVASTTATGALPTTTGPLAIGNKPTSADARDPFDGVIDDVSIHSVALTPAAIDQLWTAGNAPGGSNTPPVPVIATPTVGTTWEVGELIGFSGSATDQEDGAIPVADLTWKITIQHCPSNCHPHDVQTITGDDAGDFPAPDHLYPSWLDITLTATDSDGASASVTRRIDPRTVTLSFQTVPAGLQLDVNAEPATAPFTRTVIEGSNNALIAPLSQTVDGTTYTFQGWSDGGAASHSVLAPSSATYTATYTATGGPVVTTLVPTADAEVRSNQARKNFGTTTTLRVKSGTNRSYLKFAIPALSGTLQSAKLRVFVVDSSTSGGSAYQVSNNWTETGITWNNMPPISGTALHTAGAAPVGTWVEFTVTSVIASSTTVSFALAGGASDAVDYSSRTGANPPQLVITTTP